MLDPRGRYPGEREENALWGPTEAARFAAAERGGIVGYPGHVRRHGHEEEH